MIGLRIHADLATRTIRRLATLGCALVLCFASAAVPALPRSEAAPGGVVIVPLMPDNAPAPTAYFNDQRVLVLRHGGHWQAVIGLPLDLAPGFHWVGFSAGGEHWEYGFKVRAKIYPAQHLTLQNKQYVDPDASLLARIEQDQRVITQAFAAWNEREITELRFDAPAVGRITGRFGVRRFLNQQPRASHTGLDIAAPVGTPVTAPAPGVVLAIGDYFFTGNTLFVDHGQGLISMYCHLSKVDVVPGQALGRGDKLGEIGMTGRATGPHLHWALSLNNTRVDPALFLAIAPRPPADTAKPKGNNGP